MPLRLHLQTYANVGLTGPVQIHITSRQRLHCTFSNHGTADSDETTCTTKPSCLATPTESDDGKFSNKEDEIQALGALLLPNILLPSITASLSSLGFQRVNPAYPPQYKPIEFQVVQPRLRTETTSANNSPAPQPLRSQNLYSKPSGSAPPPSAASPGPKRAGGHQTSSGPARHPSRSFSTRRPHPVSSRPQQGRETRLQEDEHGAETGHDSGQLNTGRRGIAGDDHGLGGAWLAVAAGGGAVAFARRLGVLVVGVLGGGGRAGARVVRVVRVVLGGGRGAGRVGRRARVVVVVVVARRGVVTVRLRLVGARGLGGVVRVVRVVRHGAGGRHVHAAAARAKAFDC